MNREAGWSAIEWKRRINKHNHARFLRREIGGSGSGIVYVLSATHNVAVRIADEAQEAYPENDIELAMGKRMRRESEEPVYEFRISVTMGKRVSHELVRVAKELLSLRSKVSMKVIDETLNDVLDEIRVLRRRSFSGLVSEIWLAGQKAEEAYDDLRRDGEDWQVDLAKEDLVRWKSAYKQVGKVDVALEEAFKELATITVPVSGGYARTSAKAYVLKRDARFPSKGIELEAGTRLTLVEWTHRGPYLVRLLTPDGEKVGFPAEMAYKYLVGLDKPPNAREIERTIFDSAVKSVDGEMVEPDGFSRDGAPSWFLVLGIL